MPVEEKNAMGSRSLLPGSGSEKALSNYKLIKIYHN